MWGNRLIALYVIMSSVVRSGRLQEEITYLGVAASGCRMNKQYDL